MSVPKLFSKFIYFICTCLFVPSRPMKPRPSQRLICFGNQILCRGRCEVLQMVQRRPVERKSGHIPELGCDEWIKGRSKHVSEESGLHCKPSGHSQSTSHPGNLY